MVDVAEPTATEPPITGEQGSTSQPLEPLAVQNPFCNLNDPLNQMHQTLNFLAPFTFPNTSSTSFKLDLLEPNSGGITAGNSSVDHMGHFNSDTTPSKLPHDSAQLKHRTRALPSPVQIQPLIHYNEGAIQSSPSIENIESTIHDHSISPTGLQQLVQESARVNLEDKVLFEDGCIVMKRLSPSDFRIADNWASGAAQLDGSQNKGGLFNFNGMKGVACGILAACVVSSAAFPVTAATQRLPPLSTEPNRCERAFIGNTIGQANGVYDKPLDLRQCDYTNEKSNLKGKSLSAALMSDAKFDGADMTEVVMSKAYAVGASFKGVDFSNAVLDRVNFEKADLEGAVFKNTVLSGSTFNDAKLDNAVFEDTIIGYIDLQKLCTNKSIGDEGRAELGCR